MFVNIFDSIVMIGRYVKILVFGVDCFFYVIFIDVIFMLEILNILVINKKVVCVFEYNIGSFLWCYYVLIENFFGYYEGVLNVVLILRVIVIFVNYDYFFDFIFY